MKPLEIDFKSIFHLTAICAQTQIKHIFKNMLDLGLGGEGITSLGNSILG
jgi:hypothetical protein